MHQPLGFPPFLKNLFHKCHPFAVIKKTPIFWSAADWHQFAIAACDGSHKSCMLGPTFERQLLLWWRNKTIALPALVIESLMLCYIDSLLLKQGWMEGQVGQPHNTVERESLCHTTPPSQKVTKVIISSPFYRFSWQLSVFTSSYFAQRCQRCRSWVTTYRSFLYISFCALFWTFGDKQLKCFVNQFARKLSVSAVYVLVGFKRIKISSRGHVLSLVCLETRSLPACGAIQRFIFNNRNQQRKRGGHIDWGKNLAADKQTWRVIRGQVEIAK